jgi:tripartite-type tricarboxylate transporter receptor subunit TctC
MHDTALRRRVLHVALAAAALACGLILPSAPARAQAYPTQPIKLVVPFAAGGATDALGRLLAEQFTTRLGQAVLVENKPGASAAIGALAVAKAAPNGYTLLVGSATLASNALTSPTANLDVVSDFEFIGKLAQIDLVLATSPRLNVKDLHGFLQLARTRTLSFGSPGTGTPGHLGVELLELETRTKATHVPYKGESGAITDLLGGHLDFMLCSPPVCGAHLREGTLTPIAILSKQRSSLLPNVPTMAEAGAPRVEAGVWYYLAAPKGTPAPIVAKLNAVLNETLRDEKFRARAHEVGLETEASTTAASVRPALQAETEKWRPVVEAAGIRN